MLLVPNSCPVVDGKHVYVFFHKDGQVSILAKPYTNAVCYRLAKNTRVNRELVRKAGFRYIEQ